LYNTGLLDNGADGLKQIGDIYEGSWVVSAAEYIVGF